MAVTKPNVMYKKNFLDTIAETMFNNKHHSDVTLVVNKTHYYACKIVMSVASEVFASLISEHFNNCMDQEVLVPGVIYNESFLNILRYIHGVEINVTLTSRAVICEMISLTKEYKLSEFHKDLKVYISKLRRFRVNSVVALLNTSKTYGLNDLYDKLNIYVYQHVAEVIRHKSFVNLKYEVLLDLLKSDFLYCKEKDILRAALNWHHENIIDHVSASDNVIGSQVDISKIEDTCSDKCVTKTASTYNDNNPGDKVLNIKNKNLNQSTEGVVEIFSENVLNTLLKQIRFKKISMLDFIDIKKTETFAKYVDSIENVENKFDINEIKRKKYSGGFTTNFTVKGISEGNIEETKKYYSEEIYSSENYKWKIYLKKATQPETGANILDEKYFSLYLSCTSFERNWEFTTNAQITLISHNNFHVDYSLKFVEPKTYNKNKKKSWGWKKFISFTDLFQPNNYFIQNETITVEVIQMPSST